jgi:CHAT domain-containing protein/TPR repeat protein
MPKRVFIFALFCYGVSVTLSASGQCPDRDLLWKRLIYLRDSATKIPADSQMNELLHYKAGMVRCPYQNDSTHGLLLERIAVLYFTKADYVKAIQYTRECIRMITTHAGSPSISIRYLIDNYFNISLFYGQLGKNAEKMEAYDSCIAIAARLNSTDIYSLYAMHEKVDYLFKAGDYEHCIRYATMGELLTAQYLHGKDSTDYTFHFFIRRVNALIILKEYALADELLTAKLRGQGRSSGIYLGNVYSLLANVYEEKGQIIQAFLYFRRAFQYNMRQGYKKACSECLNDIGFLYAERSGQYDKALHYYQEALSYGDFSDSLNILEHIADIYVHKRQFDTAFHFFQQAFDQVRPGMNESALLNIPMNETVRNMTQYLIGLILDKGDACLQKYRSVRQDTAIREALKIYKAADLFLDKIRAEQTEEKSELFWRDATHRLYDHAIEACYVLGNLADAFYFIEKSRAVLLTDRILEQNRASDEDILEQAQIKKKIQALENDQGATNAASGRYSQIQTELFVCRQELNYREQLIKKRNPLYYQSFLDTSFVKLGDVQHKLLNDHQALLELFTGDSADYCLLVTSGKARLSRIDKVDLDSTANLFTAYISDPVRLNSHSGEYMQTGLHLYQLLFRDSTLPEGRTIVSEDSRWFPFEALISQITPSGPTYFLRDHAVSYTYSARFLLYNSINSPASVDGNFLGIAPTKFAGNPLLAPLPGSELSLGRIASYFHGANNLLSTRATRNNFLKEFYRYKIVQLYTHASDSSDDKSDPVIYFADSALSLSDLITEYKPATQLIVLSACETGAGKLYRGEGVFSFNRGFAALGVPSTITNLWAVDDQSTYRLNELFYKYLAQGLPADQALQKAKIEFIASGSLVERLPFYWAAPILAGNSSAITLQPSFWPEWPVILLILFVAVTAMLVIKRRYRR